jgi:hypothetical protein
MTKKSFNQEDSRPSDYHKEVEAAKRYDKTNADKLIMTLRSDMVPASSVSPAKKNIFQKLNINLIGGILIGVIILSLLWYSLAGPGRPVLEQKLAGLVNLDPTSTQQVDPSPIPSTRTIPAPSITPSSSPTVHPTHTPTMKIVATATSLSATSTPTSSTACRDVSTITLADVGKTFCVQGTVIEIIDKPNEFMLVFSYERNAFYWVSYDMVWSRAEVNTCYQIKGVIRQILNSPILVFDYSNKPEECP